MNNENHIFEFLIAALVPAFLLVMLWARLAPEMLAKFRKAKKSHQAAILLVLAFAAYATQKPPAPLVQRFTQILTFSEGLPSKFYDLSGKFVPWVKGLVNVASWEGYEAIERAAVDAIADGTNALHRLAQDVATNNIERVYISFSAHAPNDNLAIKVMQWETAEDTEGKYLDAFVFFSMIPATNVIINMEFATAVDAAPLVAVSNSYPVTQSVAGMPCYLYRYQYPATDAQLMPATDIALGGYRPDQFLDVSALIISSADDYYLPFTGWDDESTEHNQILVRYSEGIAVEIVVDGESIR